MDDYFKQLKDKLKNIKKELKALLAGYEQELEHCREISEKMSVIKMGYDNGVGDIKFDKTEIEQKIPTFCECNKYSKEIDRLEILLRNCNIEIDNPNITIKATKPYAGGISISLTEGKDAVELLHEKQHPDQTEDIGSLFEQFLKGDIEQAFRLSKLYLNFYNYAWSIDYYINNINTLINAIDNDKIKAPIKDITTLYVTMIMLKIPSQNITRILGKVIAYNANYLKKHPDYQFNHIDLIKELSKYYNEDGTLKPIEDISIFKQLLEELKEKSENYFNMLNQLFNLIRKISKDNNKFENINLDNTAIWDNITEKLINSLKLELSSQCPKEQSNEKTIKPTSKPIDRTFLEYLKQYYKNGEVIAIPQNIELFYQQLSNSSLDKQERKLIKKLMEEAIITRKNQTRLSYLTLEEKKMYEMAINLVETLSNDNEDLYLLKEYLSDLHEIFDILDNNPLDKEEWLQEIRNILIKISLICNTYIYNKPTSTNSLVFLLNKNDIPYIYEDYEGLDSTYQKAISSLINRINPQNTSNFKPVKSSHNLRYRIYEYASPIAHVFFLEIVPGIYVLLGADKAYNSYDEVNNRVVNNIGQIKALEVMIRQNRDIILKSHEIHLGLFTCGKRGHKKVRTSKKEKNNI